MTDEELAEAAELRPWERRAESIGCGLALAVGLASAVVCRWRLGSQAGLGSLAIVAGFYGGTVIGLAECVAHWRSRPYHAELRRRYGERTLASLLRSAAQALRESPEMEAAAALSGVGLPHGGSLQVEVFLLSAGGGRATVRKTPHDRPGPPAKPEQWESDLHAAQAEPVRAAVASAAEGLASIRSDVRDGFPCEVGAVWSGRVGAVRGACNLAGLSQEAAARPTCRLALALMAVARQLGAEPTLIGWCDPDGNIGGGELP